MINKYNNLIEDRYVLHSARKAMSNGFPGAWSFFVVTVHYFIKPSLVFRHSISVRRKPRKPRDGDQPAQEVLHGCLNSSYARPA